jgi:hypothetical protein
MTQPGTQTETQRISRRSFTVAAVGVLGASYASSTLGQDQSGSSATPPQDAEAQPARGPIEAEFERDYQEPSFKPLWAKPQINRAMAQDFVIFAHSDLEMTKQLLDREPGLLNATIDWGAGDFESGLGGASHMGRKDIVELLLGRGARIDIFCAAMLGMLPAIKAMLEMEPALIDAKGPHGFSLHFHAQVGQEDAKPVLDYLQSIKEVELRPVPFLQGRGNKSDG